MYESCKEHVELAMDIIIDEHEAAPIITLIDKNEKKSTSCFFCENEPTYRIDK